MCKAIIGSNRVGDTRVLVEVIGLMIRNLGPDVRTKIMKIWIRILLLMQ